MLHPIQLARLSRATQALSVAEPGDAAEQALRRRRAMHYLFGALGAFGLVLIIGSMTVGPIWWNLATLAMLAVYAIMYVRELKSISAGLAAPIERIAVAVIDRRERFATQGRAQRSIVIEDAHGQRRELRALPGADTAVVGDVGIVFVRGPWVWGFAPVA